MNFAALTEDYRRQRASLLDAYPDLAEDFVALTDTLEGLSDLKDVVSRFIRDAREDEARAKALAGIIEEMTERKRRLADRAAKREAIAMNLMVAVELPRVVEPDFTASVGWSRRAVVVTDEAALPDAYVRVTRAPDKTAIGKALTEGNEVPGATLGNGHRVLTVRTK
jgi:hypothetical protein